MPIITPKDQAAPASESIGASQAQKDSRARAIAKFMGQGSDTGNSQASPVQNPSSVSPEEMGAVKTSSSDRSFEAAVAKAKGQKDSVEETEQNAASPEEVTKDEKPEEKEPLSDRYAQLARKEKALRIKQVQQEKTFQAREEALKSREEALAAKGSDYESGYISKERLQKDFFGVMEEIGISYEQLTNEALTRNQMDPTIKAYIGKLEDKLSKLEESAKTNQENFKNTQKQQYEQALGQIKKDASRLVQDNPDFEMINATGSVQDVVDLIKKTFDETEELLTVQEAAKEIEEYLVEEAYKLSQSKKIKSRFQTPAPAPEQKPHTDQKQPQQMKTLTNSVGTTRQLSARERAILAFKGELKNS